MDLKEIRQIIELMKRNDLSLFHLEREGFKIKLRKGVDFDTVVDRLGGGLAPHGQPSGAQPQAPEPRAEYPVSPPVSATAAPTAGSDEPAPGSIRIPSPMVGTFYRAPGPGEKPFVNVGDTVEEGTTVCIIEAMKVMNEIKAETRGVITRVAVEDAKPVQFGTPLFELKPL